LKADTTPPVITYPAEIVVADRTLANVQRWSITGTPPADDCSGTTIRLAMHRPPTQAFPPSTTTVECTAPHAGNTASLQLSGGGQRYGSDPL